MARGLVLLYSTQAQAQAAEDLVCDNSGETLPSHWSLVYEHIVTNEHYFWKPLAEYMTGVTASPGYLREEEYTDAMQVPEGEE